VINIDKQRVEAGRKLEALGYSYRAGEWVRASSAPARLNPASDASKVKSPERHDGSRFKSGLATATICFSTQSASQGVGRPLQRAPAAIATPRHALPTD
jgi:hypothetical protein